MDIDEYGLPTGPVASAPRPERDAKGNMLHGGEHQADVLRAVLADAGVELGAYDEHMLRWFADLTDWQTFATVASWIRRAG